MVESHARSVAKAVSWRATGTLDTFLISWLITGTAALAGGIAATEVATKVALFYLHERAWQRFGRQKATHSHSYGHDVFLKYMGRGQAAGGRAARAPR